MRIPKKLHWQWFALLLCLLYSPLQAQNSYDERIVLFDELVELGAWKKKVLSYDLKQGEQIVIDMQTIGARKLGRLIVELPGTQFKMRMKKVRSLERESFMASKDGTHNFVMKNRGLLGRTFRMQIYKFPAMSFQDSLVLDDVMVTTSIDTMRTAYPDTIPYPDITEIQLDLQPALDYQSLADSCITEALLDGDYQYAVYWIGVGDKTHQEYQNLKANPKLSWISAEVSEPLMAYGLGLTETLPMANNSLARNLRYDFKDPRANDNYVGTQGLNPPPFGVIPAYKAGTYKQLKMCFRNLNTVTGVRVYIKVAKFQLKRAEILEIIKRERVQEIFLQKKIPVFKAEEG